MTSSQPAQTLAVFGASGPTGVQLCLRALAAGHTVRAVSRRAVDLPLPSSDRLIPMRADAASGEGVDDAVQGVDAVLSTLGVPYQWSVVTVYSQGTRRILEAMRKGDVSRLVVVSAGLTYPPPVVEGLTNRAVLPVLRHVFGRTLYADMRRMEEFLHTCDDIDWTVMRPGRLFDGPPTDYQTDLDHPRGGWTSRADLAAAMLDELGPSAHHHTAVAPTTRRR